VTDSIVLGERTILDNTREYLATALVHEIMHARLARVVVFINSRAKMVQ